MSDKSCDIFTCPIFYSKAIVCSLYFPLSVQNKFLYKNDMKCICPYGPYEFIMIMDTKPYLWPLGLMLG